MLSKIYIIFAFGLIFLNAFFVASEFAMVRLRATKVESIKDQAGWSGIILAKIHVQLDAYLSACQLGITLASLGLGWIGEPAFANVFSSFLKILHITSPQIIEIFSVSIAFTLISFLHIVLGELMPKSLAIRQSERISLWTAVPLYIFYWLMYPAIWLLNSCSTLLLKCSKLNKEHEGENFYSTDEIKIILSSSHLHGELTQQEAEILEHTLDLGELKVTDVMRPIDEMVALEAQGSIENCMKEIFEHRYSRYPVFDSEIGQMIGVVHVKEFLIGLMKDSSIDSIRPFVRPILKVSRNQPALELLRKFREGASHFALVYSGKETPIGFITWDNLLHIIVGRIRDEFHKTEDEWEMASDDSILMKGNSPLYALERALDIEILADDDINTIGGLISHQLGALPKEGDHIHFEDFSATVEQMQGPKIIQVRIKPKHSANKVETAI